jgi:hypothetical protein
VQLSRQFVIATLTMIVTLFLNRTMASDQELPAPISLDEIHRRLSAPTSLPRDPEALERIAGRKPDEIQDRNNILAEELFYITLWCGDRVDVRNAQRIILWWGPPRPGEYVAGRAVGIVYLRNGERRIIRGAICEP